MTEVARPAPSPLRGKKLLVTGSAGPLALHMAVEAERRGACVAVAASAEHGGAGDRIYRLRPDALGDAAGCELLLDSFVERFSGLDAAVVGVAAPRVGALDVLSLEEWEQCVTVPLRRAFWVARRVVWELLAGGGGGRLVLVTEPPGEGDVSSAQEGNEIVDAALLSFARSIAKEVGRRGVACNVVLAATAGPAALLPIVDAALYLASEDASFVNGQALEVRG